MLRNAIRCTPLRRSYAIQIINKAQIKEKLNKDLVIDVREPKETVNGSIPSAKLIPLGDVASALTLPAADFKNIFGFDQPGKDDPIVFYCQAGKRSEMAAKIADEVGYKKVMNYQGSWADWTA